MTRRKAAEPVTRPLAAPAAVADYLGVAELTLTQWRYQGKGPRWRKVGGRVRYDWPGIEQWLADQPGGGEGAA